MHLEDRGAVERVFESARASGVIAIDTEFMRERTYWPKLCLVQIAVDDEAWVLDPLDAGDVSWLAEVFADPGVVKVFHAGQQDLELFCRLLGVPPSPMFDTQVAATLVGFPSQVGYARMVKELAGVELDKADTFTDWARRPLTATQVEYALNDVRYLCGAYRTLREKLEQSGRLSWLDEDFARLADPRTYEVVPEDQWRRVKRAGSLNRRQLGILLEAAAWREREAQRRDLPRRWVISDESLLQVARHRPTGAAGIEGVRGVNLRSLGDGGRGLLDAVRRGEAMPDSELPRIPRRPRAAVDIEGIVELMGALVRVRASEHGIAVPLLASRADLERLAGGEREDSPLLTGWRRALIGDELLELAEGRLALRVEGGKVVPKAHAADGGRDAE